MGSGCKRPSFETRAGALLRMTFSLWWHQAPSLSAPVQTLQNRIPARRCNRPASSRRSLSRLATPARARWLAALRRRRGRVKADRARSAAAGDFKHQRAAGVKMPDLDRVDAMPVRAFAAREQEIDRGRNGASIRIEARVAKSFAKMPAFGMRLEVKPRHDVGGGRRLMHQDLFLRSRNSPNTSAGLAPFRCTLAATDGSSARRNTLAFFSSPSRVGIVGLPRRAAASLPRPRPSGQDCSARWSART